MASENEALTSSQVLSGIMAFGPLLVGLISTFVVAAYFLCRYGQPGKHHVFVTASVFLAWYFSMLIIILMPLDVSTTAYKQCLLDKQNRSQLPTHEPHSAALKAMSPPSSPPGVSTPASVILHVTLPHMNATESSTNVTTSTTSDPFHNGTTPSPEPHNDEPCTPPWSHVPGDAFPVLWRIVYWTSQLLTWILLPLMQSYSTAGDFTALGKLKTALYENAIYYGTYLVIFVVLLIYLLAQPGVHLDAAKLKVIAITASNTWGLFLLVLLLGSGLVEVPRTMWNLSRKGYTLRYLYFKAAKLSMEKCEAEEKLDDAIDELRQVNICITSGSPLRPFVDVIISKVPRDKWEDNRRHNRTTASGASVSEQSLVKLHKQVIKAMQGVNRTQVQWDMLLKDILYWEDVTKNEIGGDRRFKSSLDYLSRGQFTKMICTPTVEWYWKCMFRSLLLRCLAALFAIFTIILVWSEITFFIRVPIISIVGVIHRSLEKNCSYLGLEIMCLLALGYLCICTYYTVFKIRIFNLYYLVPHQQTSEYSLIFSGMMLCRLTPPLCLNFLGMIHLDSHLSPDSATRAETAYTAIMGHMDVISIISDGFNVYFPMLIFILCVATYLKWGSKLLHALGFEQFLSDDDLTTDLVDEGRDLVKREKNRRQRQEENENRRRQRVQNMNAANAADYGSRTNTRQGLLHSSSGESARAELLTNAETMDYTGRNDLGAQDSTTPRWNTRRPPSNIFDDV